VSRSTGITSDGRDGAERHVDRLTVESGVAAVATRVGEGTGVGMTSLDASRWDNVMVPSALGHMITMGEPGLLGRVRHVVAHR
jgi:hypothetical protein